MSSSGRIGLILLAHGARDQAWAGPFERVAAALGRKRPDAVVQLAFLEFMAPDLPQAAQTLIQVHRCSRLEVVPMFLGAGGHVRRDLPRLLDEVRTRHPETPLTLHAAIGEADEVLDAMVKAIASRVPEAKPCGLLET
jgi:sirohydrochlorin cobaltochelatase